MLMGVLHQSGFRKGCTKHFKPQDVYLRLEARDIASKCHVDRKVSTFPLFRMETAFGLCIRL